MGQAEFYSAEQEREESGGRGEEKGGWCLILIFCVDNLAGENGGRDLELEISDGDIRSSSLGQKGRDGPQLLGGMAALTMKRRCEGGPRVKERTVHIKGCIVL
jgi:hypothetical protein